MATTPKKTYQFPRNQCIACNDIIHDRNHPLLLFGSSREAEKIRLNFENLTRITLNADDPYPKKICLPCKIKLESAVGFKNLCVTSREAQEENLSHVKRGRSNEAESSSPSSKRMPSAASADSESKCNPVAHGKLVSRYRQILPDPTVEKKSLEGGGSTSEESHLLSNVGSRNLKLKEGLDIPLKNSELQKISRACSTTFLPQDFAIVILSVPPLKNALKLLHLKELQEQSKSLCKKKEDPSVLRVGSKCYQQLVSFSWAKSLTEWQERAPDVLDALSAIAVPDNYLSSPQRADAIIPPLCTAFSILLNTRNAELSLVQKMVSAVLGLGGCSKMTFQRLNKLGICQSSDSWLRIMDDVGGNLESIIKELMNEGQEPRVVYDNFDFRITPGQLTKDHQNTDNHWISQYVTFDRIDTSGMNNSHSIGDLSEFEIFNYLLNEAEQAKLRSDYIILVTRVLVKFISWLEPLKECLGHIKHRHSREMARKSVVVGLPVVPYNQNKHADVIKYLEWLQDFFKGIANDSHQDDIEDHNLNEDEHLIQIPSGGDLLGRERITGAKMLRKGCNKASERFDNMSEVAEFWHAKQAFLSLVWEHLYKIESGRDVGTLYYFRNLFGRNNVKQKVKDGFAPAEDLFLQVFNAYVIAAFMDWSGMMGMQSPPTKVSAPPDVKRNQQEKIQYLNNVIGSFVDSFCLALPNVKKAIEKQREQQQQACVQNNNNVSVQSSSISPGSILFLLKGSKESGFTFEGLAICITCCSTTHCIMVKVAKVLTETATLPNSSQPLQEGQEVTWPENLVALYRTTTAHKETSDGNSSKDQDRTADTTKDDHLANYGIWIIQMEMLLLQLNDTEKEGDGERTIINSKVLLLLFRSTTRSKKYAFEMLRFISKVKCQFTEKMAERTIHGRFVNWKGGEGNNVANDLEEEHFVQFDKKLLKGMGAQKTFKAVERATKAACGLKKIEENFDDKTGVHPPSTAHSYQNAEKDQKDMISIVCGLKPFQEVPGRCHSSFPHLPRSPFDCVDIRILEQWLKSSKQKLARDPDTPWGDEEYSPSSDEDLDDT